MNLDYEKQLDAALERLLMGEDLASVVEAYPETAADLRAHAKMMGDITSVAASIKPSPEGLRRVLGSIALREALAPERVGYVAQISHFFISYRAALVLPVLVLIVLAGGTTILKPTAHDGERSIMDQSMEEYLTEEAGGSLAMEHEATTPYAKNTTEDATSSAAPQATRMMMAPSDAPVPEDQELASVFGDELAMDAQEASDDEAQAHAGDDLSDYENTYEKDAL